MASQYEIKVACPLSPAAREIFAGLHIAAYGERTVISGELDQAALHGVLQRVRELGVELVEVRRVSARPRGNG